MNIDYSKSIEDNLSEVLNQCLVIDIETSSFYQNGEEVNISANFDDYVRFAKVKWIGLYSYKYKKSFTYNHLQPTTELFQLLSSHKVLIGFNIEDFDLPILINNGFIKDTKQYNVVDCMTILGKSTFFNKKGYPYKNRGTLMDYDFPSNSLRSMAEEMELGFQKGDIEYSIFHKDRWTLAEESMIIEYLLRDIMATKEMFDKLWSYWKPFTKFLPFKNIYDLSWIKSSIASVVYKSVCKQIGEEPTYAEQHEKTEEMGGNVIEPKLEEARKVWYVDFASLYPHIMSMFNLFAEVSSDIKGKYIWHGNEVFQVKGYYDVSRLHPISQTVMDFLKKRIALKKESPKDPMVYTLKIFLNGLYGVVRSSIFEKVHKPNAGWDCCSIGQQCQKLLIDMMNEFGFDTIAGDTDSCFLVARDDKNNNEVYVKECLKKVVSKISENAPFKAETFEIAIEHYIDYIMFPFEEQPVVGEDGKNVKVKNRLVMERKGKKKNYLYIWTNKEGKKEIELKGLPIIKNNATKLGIKIYNEVLKEKILEQGHAKFSKEYIDSIVNSYLLRPEIMEDISQEYKVKPFKTYKKETQIQAQISKEYLYGSDGIIRLIKNNLIGKVGKGTRYCTVQEAIDNKLTIKNLDLTKLNNELNPFVACHKKLAFPVTV